MWPSEQSSICTLLHGRQMLLPKSWCWARNLEERSWSYSYQIGLDCLLTVQSPISHGNRNKAFLQQNKVEEQLGSNAPAPGRGWIIMLRISFWRVRMPRLLGSAWSKSATCLDTCARLEVQSAATMDFGRLLVQATYWYPAIYRYPLHGDGPLCFKSLYVQVSTWHMFRMCTNGALMLQYNSYS